METLTLRSAEEVLAAVQDAGGAGRSLELVGRGTKRGFGRPVEADAVLDLTGVAGVVDYDPPELVLTARPGTLLREIEAALAAERQMLAFEPADLGPLLGGEAGQGTLGGMIGCNLSGPRRLRYGAARDHCLGFTGVTGQGERFKAGGKVVKNVTGYDLAKLVCGAFGTLAALTEITLKVLPRFETTRTLVLPGLDDESGVAVMTRAVGSSHEVSSAAHLPKAAAQALDLPGLDHAVTALRLEGPAPSVAARLDGLRRDLAASGRKEVLDEASSDRLWRCVRDVTPLAKADGRTVWRVSTAPQAGPAFLRALGPSAEPAYFYDWAGGLIWLALPPAGDASAERVRRALAPLGGHATLIRADCATRARVPVFQPQPEGLRALSSRIKASFDRDRVLNPGRMYAGL